MAKRKEPSPDADTPPTAGAGTYTVLARRYRPQQFGDLIGQEAVAQALINALKSNRVAHAYLFTGVRGVGKTSAARILAKALNCVQGPTATPCDVCEICQSIAAGEDVDVLEIDGASNNSVEDVRELRQNAGFRPSRSRYRIYIIDEVHMLAASAHKSAFNALLKTLEEPPAHVKFIFATTEVQKIPATILSRCQRFDFAGIGIARIVECLKAVVAGEGLQADDEALELVARRAGGSMRDAQSLLDQLLAFGGDHLTADQVHRLLGTANDDRVVALASAVLAHDARQALELLGQSADAGLQLGELLDQLINYWRDLMIVNCAGVEGQALSVTVRHRDTLAQQATALKLDTILAGLDVLNTTKARLRTSGHTRVLLEMALVRLGRLDDLVSLSQVAQWLAQPAARVDATKASLTNSTARPAAAALPPEAVKKKLTANADPAAQLVLTAESLPEVWNRVLGQLGPGFLPKYLQTAGLPAISAPNTLVLRFPAGYTQEREYCQGPAQIARLEEVVRKVAQGTWHLRIETATAGGALAAPSAAEEPSASPSGYRRQRMEAAQEPLVKRAMEVLGAQIVRVDEGFGAAPAEPRDRPEVADAEEA